MIADEKLLEWSDCLRLLESSENAHLREEAASKLKAALGRLSRELSTERFEKLGWELQQRVFALLRKEVSRSGGGESTNRSCTPIFSSMFSSTAIIKSIKSCIHTNSAIETLVELVPCGVPARTCFSRNVLPRNRARASGACLALVLWAMPGRPPCKGYAAVDTDACEPTRRIISYFLRVCT